MNSSASEKSAGPDFGALLPDTVINLVEQALGRRCTNLCRPMNSYINRVYEVGMSDGSFVIAKFYRPDRWSRAALQDEMDFLHELHDPRPTAHSCTVGRIYGLRFSLKKGGVPWMR